MWYRGVVFFIFCLVINLLFLCPISFAAEQQWSSIKLYRIHDNTSVTLKDLSDRVVLLNIWATWCPGCKAEMKEFLTLQQQFSPEEFLIVAVSVDNRVSSVTKFLKKFQQKYGKINFLILHDPEKRLAKKLNATFMPTSYLINKKGEIIETFIGSFNAETIKQLREKIKEVLQ